VRSMAYDTQTLYERALRDISLTDGESLFNSCFDSEKELTENLIPKIKTIFDRFYNEKIVSIETEKTFPLRDLGFWNIRVDIFVTTESGMNYVIECKNPTHNVAEMNIAVGQLMNYEVALRKVGNPCKIILAIPEYEYSLFEIFYRFRLPFDIIVNNKDATAVWINEFI